MLSLLKQYGTYAAGALAIAFLLYLCHSFDKKIDALNSELKQAYSTIAIKEEEATRVAMATAKRDEAYEQQDKQLSDITRQIRSLTKSTQELRDIMSLPIPDSAVSMLRGRAHNNKTGSTGSPASAPRAAGVKR